MIISTSIVYKLKSKVRQVLDYIATVLIAPVVMIIVILRPIVIIRFGKIRSERIGHFTGDVAAYVCRRNEDKKHRYIDIIGCPRFTCNDFLRSMWARTIKITPYVGLCEFLDQQCRFWTQSDIHHIKLVVNYSEYNKILKADPVLYFTEEENKRGLQILSELGIPFGIPWVCIHNRDSAYLNITQSGSFVHHDYRNFSVKSISAACEKLAHLGYYVLRMGSIVEEKLISINPQIIDYASSSLRSDFADVYLMGNCTAYIGSDSGIAILPLIFKKPVYFINQSATLLHIMALYNPLPFLIKNLWCLEENKFLTISQMIEKGLFGVSLSSDFAQKNIEVVENSSEDIVDFVFEIDRRLKAKWEQLPEDEFLQKKLNQILQKSMLKKGIEHSNIRLGSTFLNKYQNILD
jgi:putative glycosyltransferase (TIGR04372 family)